MREKKREGMCGGRTEGERERQIILWRLHVQWAAHGSFDLRTVRSWPEVKSSPMLNHLSHTSTPQGCLLQAMKRILIMIYTYRIQGIIILGLDATYFVCPWILILYSTLATSVVSLWSLKCRVTLPSRILTVLSHPGFPMFWICFSFSK